MSDPRAGLIIAAQDATGAAFASANGRLTALESNARRASGGIATGFKNFSSSVLSARSALASLGIVLSGRAIFSWMSNAVQATAAVGEQREEVLRAKQAFAEFRAASDSLAESLAVRLQPAISGMAKVLIELRKARDDGGTPAEIISDRLAGAQRELAALEQSINAPFRDQYQGEEARAAQDARARQLRENIRVLEAAQGASRDPLQEFDLAAIGSKRMAEDKIGLMLARQRDAQRVAAQQAREEERREVDEHVAAIAIAEQERQAETAAKEAAQAERRRELLAQQADDLRLNLMTEVEYEAEIYVRRQEMLDAALEEKLLSEERHAQLKTELERQTEQTIAEIRQREAKREQQLRVQQIASVGNLFGALAAIASVGANESKKRFEQHKKLATAEAIVNTYAAVAYALKNPPGPPFSYVNAAAAAAFGFAQVKAIQSTSWSGGGGAGAGGFGAGGGAAAATLPNERTAGLLSGDGSGGRGGSQINITIMPGIVGKVDGETARVIATAIKHEIDSNDIEIMSRSSRQALTIRGAGVENE